MAGPVSTTGPVLKRFSKERRALKEYKYEGETFQLDDRKGCYVEVIHEGGAIGYLGVALADGTSESPYAWNYRNPITNGWDYGPPRITPNGLQGGATVRTVEAGLTQICRTYLRLLNEKRQREEFKPEAACETLHKYLEELP